MVHSLKVGYSLASRVSSKATQVCKTNLVEYIRYKASNFIKFRRSKKFIFNINLVQDFLLSLFYLVFFIYYIIQRLYNYNLFISFNLYTLVTQEGLQVVDNNRVIGFKDSFYKVYKVFLILLPQIIVHKLKISVFKDLETDIVVNIIYKYNINSLSPLLLTFANLLTGICHTVQCGVVHSGWGRSYNSL